MAPQSLGGHELEKRIIVFGLMTPHFYLICIAQSCNEKPTKLVMNTQF
jgi:hypothetical protein